VQLRDPSDRSPPRRLSASVDHRHGRSEQSIRRPCVGKQVSMLCSPMVAVKRWTAGIFVQSQNRGVISLCSSVVIWIAILTGRIEKASVPEVDSGFTAITRPPAQSRLLPVPAAKPRRRDHTSGEEMTSNIAESSRLRRLVPAILIATAAFGAVAGISMEAAGVASARPNRCADGQCPPPHPPNESTHPGGSPSYYPGAPAPAPTQTFVCGEPGEPCFTLTPDPYGL
jgi:hypothetical protein